MASEGEKAVVTPSGQPWQYLKELFQATVLKVYLVIVASFSCILLAVYKDLEELDWESEIDIQAPGIFVNLTSEKTSENLSFLSDS